MTLPASGTIAFTNLNSELGRASTAAGTNLNETVVRTLFVKPTAGSAIALSDGYGKTYRKTLSVVYSASVGNVTLALGSISGYVAGLSDITITVNSGVYIYADSTTAAALIITGGTTGDTLRIVNNGYIIGKGGAGGATPSGAVSPQTAPTAGGRAINSAYRITQITGTGYIAGGGGGGGLAQTSTSQPHGGGGGGAGGGIGGQVYYVIGVGLASGGSGGGLGAAGSNGALVSPAAAGGGGGRVLPGSGGAGSTSISPGAASATGGGGGGAGGGGGTGNYANSTGTGGGGGGWGAAGGTGYYGNSAGMSVSGSNAGGAGNAAGGTAPTSSVATTTAGAAGGQAIFTNSLGIGTISCTVYGAVV